MVKGKNRTFEINVREDTWMVQLGLLSKHAQRIVIRNFSPDSTNLPFIRRVSADNNLFISSWDEDLVLEKEIPTNSLGA